MQKKISLKFLRSYLLTLIILLTCIVIINLIIDPFGVYHIVEINGINNVDGNEEITEGQTLPWLQDTETTDLWTLWSVAYRDIIILDGENKRTYIYNLTTYDLGKKANKATFKALLLEVAQATADAE